jgi:hypothetical protein
VSRPRGSQFVAAHRGQRASAREPAPDAGRRIARAASFLTVTAVLAPVVQNWRTHPVDGFPFSYYPMFTAKRTQRTRVTHLIGYDAAGRRHHLSHRLVGEGGLNQVRRQLRRLALGGEAGAVCERVAARCARARTGLHADLVTVQIVTGEYRLRDYFAGACEPRSETIHASVTVERTGKRRGR